VNVHICSKVLAMAPVAAEISLFPNAEAAKQYLQLPRNWATQAGSVQTA
jgi:hypothetical protein